VSDLVDEDEDCQDGDDIETVDESFRHRKPRSNRCGQLNGTSSRLILA
jgi:hypothetical protein